MIFTWILLGILCAIIASIKGYKGILWFLLWLFIGYQLGVLSIGIIILIPSRNKFNAHKKGDKK